MNFLITLFAFFSISSAFSQAINHISTVKTANLTDEEKHISETYVHEGKGQEFLSKECNVSEEMKLACQGEDPDPKVMGISSSIMKIATKAYTTVIGAMSASGKGGGLEMKENNNTQNNAANGEQQPQQQEQKKEEKQDDTDYCQYIAVGVETVATFMQQLSQKKLQKESLKLKGSTEQKKLLYTAARSHKERFRNTKVQAGGWGATGTCYTAMLLRPSVNAFSMKNLLKIGSSWFLTAFYFKLAQEHEKYYKKIKTLADRLPGKGDCNPVTDRDCYCAQESTANDPKYCLPEIHQRVVAANSFRVACTTDKLKADPQCHCRTTKTCYDTVVQKGLQVTATDINKALSAQFLKAYKPLANGELQSAQLSGSALSLAKNARRKLNSLKNKFPKRKKPVYFSKSQQRGIDELKSFGVPNRLAQELVLKPFGAADKKNLAKFSGGSRDYNNSSRSNYQRQKKSNVLRFSSSNRRTRKSNRRKSKNPFKKGRKSSRAGKVLRFNENNKYANKAANQAGINKSKETHLFKIISHRYMLSGRKRLGIEL